MKESDENYGKAWYSLSGNDRDVVLSSRVRLIRNLANFPFPENFKNDDAERVKAIISDAFHKLENASLFHSINSSFLTSENRKILEERGVLKSDDELKSSNHLKEDAVILNYEGDFSAVINETDHLRLSSFKSGLSFRKCFENVKSLDDELQGFLQFAASYDFGYLTASVNDLGTGMKISALISIPAILKCGKLKDIVDYLKSKNAIIKPAFPYLLKDKSSPLSPYFLVSSLNCYPDSEVDKIASMEAICKYICEYERKILKDFADNYITVIKNDVVRSYSIARTSLLMTFFDALDVISNLQVGVRLNLVEGTDNDTLSSLVYRIQDGHLSYLIENNDFGFSEDVIKDRTLKIARLRAEILKESIENISLRKL